MRLRLTDTSYIWLRSEGFSYRALRATVPDYSVFRVASADVSLLQAASVRTRLVHYLREQDSCSLFDSVGLRYTSFSSERLVSADAAVLSFYKSAFSVASPSCRQAWSFRKSFLDSSDAVSAATCVFHALRFGTASATDSVQRSFTISLRDAVVAGSVVDFDGTFSHDSHDSALMADALYSRLVIKRKSFAVASDSVVFGVRYLVDFYFGGLSFGGSPFGGRIL